MLYNIICFPCRCLISVFVCLFTLNQQAGSVEHLPLVTVRPAGVRPSVISGDAQDGESAVVNLQRHGGQAGGDVSDRRKQPIKDELDETGWHPGCQGNSHTTAAG